MLDRTVIYHAAFFAGLFRLFPKILYYVLLERTHGGNPASIDTEDCWRQLSRKDTVVRVPVLHGPKGLSRRSLHPRRGSRFAASVLAWLVVLSLLLTGQQITAAEDSPRDLSDGQEAAIYGASAAIFLTGALARRLHSGKPIVTSSWPNSLDRFMRNVIHGESGTKTNFIDRKLGGILTPTAALVALGIIDLNREEFSRDIPFYLSGLATTNGITVITKSLVQRPRPYCLPSGQPPPELPFDAPDHHQSFFSGHTSMAFYGATFFNLRFRRFMQQNWKPDEYRVGRWVSPIVSFGWASFVGFSRIHADKHYFTDVLAGAILGTAIAELYYSLAYDSDDTNSPRSGNGLQLSVKFTF